MPVLSFLLLLGLLQATHIPVLSAEQCYEGAAWQCGIVLWDLWLGFNKWPFLSFVFPWGGGYASTLANGGCLGTPAFRLLFCLISNISGHFFPRLSGPALAVSCRWNVVLGKFCGSWQGKFLWGAAVICGKTCFIVEFIPAQPLLLLSMGLNNSAKIWGKGRWVLYARRC